MRGGRESDRLLAWLAAAVAMLAVIYILMLSFQIQWQNHADEESRFYDEVVCLMRNPEKKEACD